MILGSVNISFNGFQIFDAEMHYRFHHKSLSEVNCKKSFEIC